MIKMEKILQKIYLTRFAFAKRVWKDFEIKDLYAHSDTLLLAAVRTFKIYVLNILAWSCSCSYCTRFSRASRFKKTKIKLDLLTNIDMLLMIEKSIRREICYSVYRHVTDINKYMKDENRNKELSYLKY